MMPGHAACKKIAIAAAPLDRALLALAQQADVDIASTETDLHKARSNRVEGCFAAGEALRTLMRGSGFRVVSAGARSFRIVRAPAPAPAAGQERDAGTIEPPRPDLIVTGAKLPVALLRFPGSVQILDVDPHAGAARGRTMDEVASRTPILQKTELGIGRNKLFIRGIADSSFNGPTQATATLYFGDVQLNYAGPEPALSLYDMARVEIFEGPQETLYGAGAISGIVRLTPRPADLAAFGGATAMGVTATRRGEPGYDLSGMINLPILRDVVGVRFVGYRSRDGGYIDDHQRGLSNVNRTETIGGRGSLRIEPGDGWSIELGALGQRIDAADATYAEAPVGPLARHTALAQPYRSGIWLARAVVRRQWDSGIEMTSATGLVRTDTSDRFDATQAYAFFNVPLIYQVDNAGLLITHETRVSRASARGLSWVAGAAFLYDRDAQSRVIGQPAIPIEIVGVTNITRSAALFGEATLPVTSTLAVTLGARASIARTHGEPSLVPREAPSEAGLLLRRVEPALALSWLLRPRLAAFARFQSGYRTGGIAVARGIGRVANFRSDSIRVGEVGLRLERAGARGLALSTALSVARWQDIQADLFSARSQPYTDNIGDADIVAVEATGDWIPLDGARASFALLWTQNRTRGALAETSEFANRRLPDTPPFSGSLDLRYRHEMIGGRSVELAGNARYVGRSVLGAGSFLDISQGDYVTLGLSGAWRWNNLEATIEIENLTDRSDARFAMGNPLTFGSRDQLVPLRPRSLRVGLGLHW
jgi:outer membrane receptor protein involved in Fe transport